MLADAAAYIGLLQMMCAYFNGQIGQISNISLGLLQVLP